MFLISNFYNVFYLTGFKGLNPQEREAFALLTDEEIYLITDGRHDIKKFEDRKLKIEVLELRTDKNLVQHLEEIIQKKKIKKLQIESEDLTVLEFNLLKQKLRGIKLIPEEHYFQHKRSVKTDEEINKISHACRVADQCLTEILKTVKVGQTESEIAFKIEFWMKRMGYEISFSPIVAIDENSAVPHYDTRLNGKKKLEKNSILLIDYGARVEDYCSDTTRVIFVGQPNKEALDNYQKLLIVQEKTINEISRLARNDSSLRQVDGFCRKSLKELGLPNFSHSTGHGIGLEVHEYPRVSQKSKDKLQSNQVFTIEPGVYIPGKFGLRIEDTLYVDKNKELIILTNFTKKPFFLRV